MKITQLAVPNEDAFQVQGEVATLKDFERKNNCLYPFYGEVCDCRHVDSGIRFSSDVEVLICVLRIDGEEIGECSDNIDCSLKVNPEILAHPRIVEDIVRIHLCVLVRKPNESRRFQENDTGLLKAELYIDRPLCSS